MKKYVSDKFKITGGNNVAILDFVVGQDYIIGDSGYIADKLYKVNTDFTYADPVLDLVNLTPEGQGGNPEFATAKIGNISGGNYSEFETDGTYKANGDATYYRDVFPGGPFHPAAGASAPDLINETIGGVATRKYEFDGNITEERLSNTFEIPHDYMYGSEIEVHIHWRPSDNTAGDVKRFFDWSYNPVNGAPVAQTTLSAVNTVNINELHYHKIKAIGTIPANGYTIGDIICFNIRRTPSDVEDTYESDAIFEQIALHIQIDTLGSRQRYVK